ncbi:protein RALF-like 9 [Raphanus sativus]|uniref:Protein RALF-like 9 n=1 Tax=Raphanus sativus TaxID=3726 RepID=A0A6J0L5B8_RAPSA|nr:protein RALF-like 9 [Raphanus sativus]
MGMAKTIKVIFSLAFVVFLAFAATNIEARYISYFGLHKGDPEFGCSKLHPQFCKKVQANPYRRGCEASQRCRDNAQK